MQRRNARQRQEFLYRKQLQASEAASYNHKEQLQQALETGKSIPDHLRADAINLAEHMLFDDVTTKMKGLDDDEYANAKIPKLLLTTSRNPSSRLRNFAKELRYLFPNTQRVNRGRHVISELVDVARSNGFTDLLIIHETRGNPDGLVLSHLPYGPTAYFTLSNVVLRSETNSDETVPEHAPHLIFEGMHSKLGARLTQILKHLFPTGNKSAKRVCSFINRQDSIVFRNHIYRKVGPEVVLKEIGPRFCLHPYMIRLDTVESTASETEWRLYNFTNTAHLKQYL